MSFKYLAEVEGKGGINAKLVAYSISPEGKKIATFELTYHRYIHGEFMTHRLFSRNAMSSRAVPVSKMLDIIRKSPAMPIHWGENQRGMQAGKEIDERVQAEWEGSRETWGSKEDVWVEASQVAAFYAENFSNAGYAKQIVNRLVEPFQMMKTVMTATELDNFFWLRLDEDAQPEIFELARCMKECLEKKKPVLLQPGQWHTPYVSHGIEYIKGTSDTPEGSQYIFKGYFLLRQSEDDEYPDLVEISKEEALAISSSCCAQVSYRNLDNTYEKAMAIYDRLLNGAKAHSSPFEHSATPIEGLNRCLDSYTHSDFWPKGVTHMDKNGDFWSGNFKSWIQYRQLLENHTCWEYKE